MSFAILRHGKIKSASRGAAIAHNHRLGEIDQVNINQAQKHLNLCFFGDGLAERISQLLPEKIRKDAVVAVEVLLTSGPEFFDGMEKDRTQLAKNPAFLDWVNTSIAWAKKEFGGTLVDATLHMDESTPHIHLMAVPLTQDGRLCAKEVMARPELQRRQTGYAQAMSGLGLQRGEPAIETKRRHIRLKEDAGSGGKSSQDLARSREALEKLRNNVVQWAAADALKTKDLEARLASARRERDSLLERAEKLEKRNKLLSEGLLEERAKFVASQVVPEQVLPAQGATQEVAQEAFSEQWGGCEVREPGAAAHGRLLAVCGQQAVFQIRGVPYLCTYPQGVPPPSLKSQAEQQRQGISR